MTGLDNLLAPCWLGYLGCARLLRCTLFFRSTCFILWKRKKTLGLYIFNLLGKIMKKLKWVSRNIYIYIYIYIYLYIYYILHIYICICHITLLYIVNTSVLVIFSSCFHIWLQIIYIYIYILYIYIYLYITII